VFFADHLRAREGKDAFRWRFPRPQPSPEYRGKDSSKWHDRTLARRVATAK
jgi:hypothetical protein